MTAITIVISAFTASTKLEATLKSILGQTLKNVEIICIINLHTDSCDIIANKYAFCGLKIQYAKIQEPKSVLQMAETVLSSACGKYVLFLHEGDIFHHKNSCRRLVRIMRIKKMDILHFAVDLSMDQVVDSSQSNWKAHQKPLIKRLIGKDILTECFEKKQYSCSIYDKVFTYELLQKAFRNDSDLCGEAGDEAAAYFILASVADVYMGTRAQYIKYDDNLYDVQYISADGLVRMLEKYLVKNDLFNKHRISFECFSKWMLQMELRRWYYQLNRQTGDLIFQNICGAWGIVTVLSELAQMHWQQPDLVADRLKQMSVIEPNRKKIKTIGTFYYRIGNGGLERVLTTLIALWTAEGYHVVLFLDDRSDGEEYALPDGVERVILPDTFKINESTIKSRIQTWQDELREHNVDIVIGHAWISPILLWDMLSVKAMHIPFVQYTHGAFSCLLMESDNQTNHYFAQLTHVYGLCDCVVTLSSVNQAFWQCFCDHVYMICNPSHLDIEKVLPAKLETPDVVWVGRISPEKRPMDAIHIMRLVADAVPEAKLHIVGKAEDHLAHLEEELHTEIRKMHLDENVVLEGFHQNTDVYYQNGSIYLSTSAYEGFPMALMESKIFGLPCVMYDLPYLEVSRDPAGLLAVPQGDIEEAAESIIRLLRQVEERRQMGREARESARMYSKKAVVQAWASLFQEMENPPDKTKQKGDIDIMLQTIMEHLRLGSEKRLRQEADLSRISSFVLMRKVRSVLHCFRTQGWREVWKMVAKKLHALMNKQA